MACTYLYLKQIKIVLDPRKTAEAFHQRSLKPFLPCSSGKWNPYSAHCNFSIFRIFISKSVAMCAISVGKQILIKNNFWLNTFTWQGFPNQKRSLRYQSSYFSNNHKEYQRLDKCSVFSGERMKKATCSKILSGVNRVRQRFSWQGHCIEQPEDTISEAKYNLLQLLFASRHDLGTLQQLEKGRNKCTVPVTQN